MHIVIPCRISTGLALNQMCSELHQEGWTFEFEDRSLDAISQRLLGEK